MVSFIFVSTLHQFIFYSTGWEAAWIKEVWEAVWGELLRVCLSFVILVWGCSSQMKITFSNFSNSILCCLLLTTAPHQWEAAWAWIRVEWAWIKEGKSSLDLLLLISRSESENRLLRDNFRSLIWDGILHFCLNFASIHLLLDRMGGGMNKGGMGGGMGWAMACLSLVCDTRLRILKPDENYIL